MNIGQIANQTLTRNANSNDYKQLYQQTKKNVALFIATVDQEISKILGKHAQELQALKDQNQELKSQIYYQNKSILVSNKSNLPISSRQNSRQHKPYNSISKFQTQQKCKGFYECGLSDISLAESKSIFSQNKKKSIITYVLGEKRQNFIDHSILQTKASVNYQSNQLKNTFNLSQKNQSSMLKSNQDNQKKELQNMKQKINSSRRHKRHISLMEGSQDKQNLKDLLKHIRQNINTPEYCIQLMKDQQQRQRRITIVPEMFKRNN